MEPLIDTFPWILWYIYKARNEKVFNGKEISARDRFHLASIKIECWRVANLEEVEAEFFQLQFMRLLQFLSLDPQTLTCQIDGIGWTYRDQTGI